MNTLLRECCKNQYNKPEGQNYPECFFPPQKATQLVPSLILQIILNLTKDYKICTLLDNEMGGI